MVKGTWRSRRNADLFNHVYNQSIERPVKVVVFDTETIGLNADIDRVIQFSAQTYELRNGVITKTDEYDQYINPEMHIPEAASAVNGITDEFIRDYPTEAEVFERIYNTLATADAWSGHNVTFDIKFMDAMYQRYGKRFQPTVVLDTLQAARDLIDKTSVENFKLATLAVFYGADKDLTFHNSMDDVTATARILEIFLEEYHNRSASESTAEDSPTTLEDMLSKIQNAAPAAPAKVLHVPKVQFMSDFTIWRKDPNKGMQRTYVYTDCGTFYFDRRQFVWGYKEDSMKYPFDEIDMEAFVLACYRWAGCADENEFRHYQPPKKGEKAKSFGNPADYMFKSGKYAGEKIRDIYKKDPDFIRWCAERMEVASKYLESIA